MSTAPPTVALVPSMQLATVWRPEFQKIVPLARDPRMDPDLTNAIMGQG